MESTDKNKPSDEELVGDLKGNTLLIYWYMIRANKPLGAREIQRNTGLSSSRVCWVCISVQGGSLLQDSFYMLCSSHRCLFLPS